MSDYFWQFRENDAIKGKVKFGVRSRDSNYEVLIDNDIIKPLGLSNFVTIKYDSKGINTENNCRASDYMYLNEEWQGVLPYDGKVGKVVSINQLKKAKTVLRIIIGGYWGDGIYDINKPHGTLYQGLYKDDFQIGNLRLEDEAGFITKPEKLVLYKPKAVGEIGFNTYEVIPNDELFWMGDGSANNESYDSHPNPRYNIPFQVEYYFNFDDSFAIPLFELDTSQYSNGLHQLIIKKDHKIIKETTILIDNDAPIININLFDDQTITNNYPLIVDISDKTSSIAQQYLKLDGKMVNSFDLTSLSKGVHNLVIYASDLAGNESFHYVNFRVSEADSFTRTLIDIPYEITSYDHFDEIKVYCNEPFALFYEGKAYKHEKMMIEGFNFKNNQFEVLAIFNHNTIVNIPIDFINDYLLLRVSQYRLNNNSNALLWMTDTQHLTRFPDLFKYNKFLMNHTLTQYQKRDIGFMVHTGDIVDFPPPNKESYNQWLIVDEAFKLLDDFDIPYGVVSGNHDVDSQLDNLNYSYFTKFFGNHRFNQKPYFGGALNDNESHYDLVTIANHDFILLYLGYGLEKNNETINWANKVLKKYQHRSAIICVHSYLSSITGDLDKYSQAEAIYHNIIVPNNNVRLLLCGHMDGAVTNKRVINGRNFYEIMACYQFVELAKWDHLHLAGVIPTCNGEGYMRKMTFIDGKMHSTTYSPITNGPMPFGEKDDFWLDFPLTKSLSFIKTKTLKKAL